VRRLLLHFLCALSLLLCLAFVAAWVRSGFRHECVYCYHYNEDEPQERLVVLSSGGGIVKLQSSWSLYRASASDWKRYREGNYRPAGVYYNPEYTYFDPGMAQTFRRLPHGWYFAGFGSAWNRSSEMDPAAVPPRLRVVFAFRDVAAPWWALVLMTAAAPAWQAVRIARGRRRRRRVRAGLCAKCGYDLRASSGRCPECGRAAEKLRPTFEVGRAAC
jgi:hypothetical protein